MEARVLFLLAFFGFVHTSLIKTSCQDVRRFVDGHNNRRYKLAQGKISGQPAASRMSFMAWDDELAAKARKWAMSFPTGHNPDHSVQSGKFKTGENLYWYSITDQKYNLDIDSALTAWFDEYKDFTYGPIKSSQFSGSRPQIGHYTQMAWSDTTHVGCAVTQKVEGGWKKFFVVCNYGPAGNYIGEVPYPKGKGSKLLCVGKNCDKPYGSRC